MSAARIIGVSIPLFLLVIAAVGALWVLRQERRDPSSYPRQEGVRGDLPAWRGLSTDQQREVDDAALGGPANVRQTPEEAAEVRERAESDAVEAAEFAVYRMNQVNVLYRP